MKLCDLFEGRRRLDQGELEVLGLLIHDKKHFTSRGNRHGDLDSAIEKLKTKSKKDLYRGVSDVELELIRSDKANFYLSFSEDINIAKRYGKVITLKSGAIGLNYWEWGEADQLAQKKEDPKDWDAQDGEFMLETFREEKEWVFPFHMKLTENENLVFETKS